MKPCDSCCPQIHCQPFQKIMSKFHLKQLATQDPYIDILQTYMQCIYDYVYSTFRVEMSNNGGTHFRKPFFVSQRKRMSQVLPEVLFFLNFTSLLTRAGTSSAKNTQAYQTSSDIIRYQDFLVIFRSDPMPIQGKHLQSVPRYVQNPGTSSSATPISAVDHLEISLCHCRWCLGYPIHRCLVVG